MAYGSEKIGDEWVQFGFSSFSDWIQSVVLSFPAPWTVCSLDGKYYGTTIKDATGKEILSFWMATGEPSIRQRQGMTDEEWSEYCCDCHWESIVSLSIASAVVALRNAIGREGFGRGEYKSSLVHLVSMGEWEQSAWEDVSAGGPLKRALKSQTHRH